MSFNFGDVFRAKLAAKQPNYNACGVVALDGTVYPLGSDTKVLSTIFELFTQPIMIEIANEHGFQLVEPTMQNHYPDFTLLKDRADKRKIAVDVKTTYVDGPDGSFSYTLGGYTSFIRKGNESKNIVFPFNEYAEHWVVGYVYERLIDKKSGSRTTFKLDQLDKIPLAYKNVRVFVQEKWRIASGSAGSGNTTNIGSINARISDFERGAGQFSSEEEFLDYWRNYGRTDADREGKFRNIDGYRTWRRSNK